MQIRHSENFKSPEKFKVACSRRTRTSVGAVETESCFLGAPADPCSAGVVKSSCAAAPRTARSRALASRGRMCCGAERVTDAFNSSSPNSRVFAATLVLTLESRSDSLHVCSL